MSELLAGIQRLQIPGLLRQINRLTEDLRKQDLKLIQANRRIVELEIELSDAVAMAIYDPLTGAVTRKEMEREIAICLANLKRAKQLRPHANTTEEDFSVLFFDLNGLKAVNDTFGHKAGDILIKTFGSALRIHFKRETDVVCRWGGDEFVVLLGGVASKEVTMDIVHEFMVALEEITLEFAFENSPPESGVKHNVAVSVAVGISSTAGGALTVEGLISEADESMYCHKKQSRQSR